jgi:hypothetical protein
LTAFPLPPARRAGTAAESPLAGKSPCQPGVGPPMLRITQKYDNLAKGTLPPRRRRCDPPKTNQRITTDTAVRCLSPTRSPDRFAGPPAALDQRSSKRQSGVPSRMITILERVITITHRRRQAPRKCGAAGRLWAVTSRRDRAKKTAVPSIQPFQPYRKRVITLFRAGRVVHPRCETGNW